jgi:hypothetical protein
MELPGPVRIAVPVDDRHIKALGQQALPQALIGGTPRCQH